MVILIATIVLLLLLGAGAYNNLVTSKNTVKEAESTMGVYLKKRRDLIPNLVATVKGYAGHEKETFEEVIKLRNTSVGNFEVENKITKNVNKIMALAENYPALKASENFKDLSAQLAKIEEDIAYARKYYNGTVKNYNNLVEKLPTALFARLFGHSPKQMFEIKEEDKENVKVEF